MSTPRRAGEPKGGTPLKRIYKFAAIGASGALLAVAVAPAAVAAGTANGSVAKAHTAATLPNSNIKGKPAKWSPSKLTAKARWSGPPTQCSVAQGSFTMNNTTKKGQTVKITGTKHFTPFSGTIPAKTKVVDCVTKGYKGTLTVKLKDGKKLTVKF